MPRRISIDERLIIILKQLFDDDEIVKRVDGWIVENGKKISIQFI